MRDHLIQQFTKSQDSWKFEEKHILGNYSGSWQQKAQTNMFASYLVISTASQFQTSRDTFDFET